MFTVQRVWLHPRMQVSEQKHEIRLVKGLKGLVTLVFIGQAQKDGDEKQYLQHQYQQQKARTTTTTTTPAAAAATTATATATATTTDCYYN